MENASKALLLAGSLLISLIIISMLMLVINSLTSYQDSQSLTVEAKQLEEFNRQIVAYNREDVRGNELITLANKIVDYNRTRTQVTKQDYDNTKGLTYQPISLMVEMNTKVTANGKTQNVFDNIGDLNGAHNLLKKYSSNSYYNSDYFENVFNRAHYVLEAKYPAGALNRLATHTTGLFLDTDLSDKAKKDAINAFNIDYGYSILKYGTTDWKKLKAKNPDDFIYDNSNPAAPKKTKIVKDVYEYYEYVQFKRCKFECSNINYDTNGAVTGLEFKFTGDVE